MNNITLQNIIVDAYQYHFIQWLDRINKHYTQKSKIKQNRQLIQYHDSKMREYENMLKELKEKGVNII